MLQRLAQRLGTSLRGRAVAAQSLTTNADVHVAAQRAHDRTETTRPLLWLRSAPRLAWAAHTGVKPATGGAPTASATFEWRAHDADVARTRTRAHAARGPSSAHTATPGPAGIGARAHRLARAGLLSHPLLEQAAGLHYRGVGRQMHAREFGPQAPGITRTDWVRLADAVAAAAQARSQAQAGQAQPGARHLRGEM